MSRKKFLFRVTLFSVTLVMTLFAASATLEQLKTMTARFAPVELRSDTSHLSAGDRAALPKLVAAARIIDQIFLTQMWSGNQALYTRLKADSSPIGKARLDYFWLNKGPWTQLDENRAFLEG